jgi:hypothetical protein
MNMSEANNQSSTICAALEYDRKWIAYGFLTESDLEKQYEQFLHSQDQNTEHYRYASFSAFLSRHTVLTDEQINNFIELAALDPDQVMATAALGELLRFRQLSVSQFKYLCDHPAFRKPALQKLIQIKVLIHDLAQPDELTDADFETYFASRNPVVQTWLLSHPSMTRKYLERLGEGGANRAVRNQAKEMLNQQKFR